MEFDVHSVKLITLTNIENLIGRDTIAKLIYEIETAAKQGNVFVYIDGNKYDIEEWYLPIRYFRLKGFGVTQISRKEIKVNWD